MDRSFLIIVAQAAVSGGLLTDRRVFAAVVEGGSGGASGAGGDHIAQAMTLMHRVINTNDLMRDFQKHYKIGGWQSKDTPDQIDHDRLAKIRAPSFDKDRFVSIARDHIANCENLYRHLTDRFDADMAAAAEVAKLFDYTWDDIPLLTISQLRSMLSTVIPIAIVRQLFQGFNLQYVHWYSPQFLRFAKKYRSVVLR